MRQIFNSGTEMQEDHREDFETCPNCSRKMDSNKWLKISHTLILEPRFYRRGSVVIISECPKCFHSSWIHEPIDSFKYNDFPVKWKEAVERQGEKLKIKALRDWAFSLCGRCKKLTNGRVEYSTYRDCEIGSGSAEKECCYFRAYNETA
jgi:hypothetical protein